MGSPASPRPVCARLGGLGVPPGSHGIETWELVAKSARASGGDTDGGGRFLPICETGPPVANIDILTGVRDPGERPGLARKGGARNAAGRTSFALSKRHARAICEAARFAWRKGLPLNRHITIHWQRAGITDSQAAAATGYFLRLLRDWLRKRGLATAWVWARENGPHKGSHVHILVHLPPGVVWRGGRSRRWLERVTGRRYAPSVIKTTRIAGRADAARSIPAHYEANLDAVVGYLTKDGPGGKGEGGRIIGKRCGFSQNIGPAARHLAQNARVADHSAG